MEYYSAIRRKQILPFATTWMELEGIMLSEISQGEREIPNDFTHLWSIRTKEKLKEKNSSRITEPKNGLTVTKRKATGEGGNGEIRGEMGHYD